MKRIIKIGLIAFTSLLAVSCAKQNSLEKRFNCDSTAFEAVKRTYDFNKNFSLKIPINWKSNFYYSPVMSEIYFADTTKQLSESFIFNVAFHSAELKFDSEFYRKTDSLLKSNELEIIDADKTNLFESDSYWYLVKGFKNGFPFHQLNIMAKRSASTYFSASTEVYGNNQVNERLCTSITLLNSIEFLE